jgi:diguanylate cyclase (GGDEF)-like protein
MIELGTTVELLFRGGGPVDRRILALVSTSVAAAIAAFIGIATEPVIGCIAALALAAVALGVSWALYSDIKLLRNQSSADAVDTVTLRHLEVLQRGGPKPLIDLETGLPDERFFEIALDGRVAAARRHLWPVTLVLIEIAMTEAADDPAVRQEALARFSLLLRRTMRESDVLSRIDEHRFALLLDDTAEEGGVWSAERLQVESAREHPVIRRLVAGVASYPSHGLGAPEVLAAANAALQRAASADAGHGLGLVEVARLEH